MNLFNIFIFYIIKKKNIYIPKSYFQQFAATEKDNFICILSHIALIQKLVKGLVFFWKKLDIPTIVIERNLQLCDKYLVF